MSDTHKLELKLKQLKEALFKNVNTSYGSPSPNTSETAMKGEAKPKPKKPSGNGGAPAQTSLPKPPSRPQPQPTEVLSLSKNGQWSLEKAKNPEDVQKELRRIADVKLKNNKRDPFGEPRIKPQNAGWHGPADAEFKGKRYDEPRLKLPNEELIKPADTKSPTKAKPN